MFNKQDKYRIKQCDAYWSTVRDFLLVFTRDVKI